MTVTTETSLDEILAKLRAFEPAIRAHGITRLAVFGSRVRGDHRHDSDLDILIEHDPSRRFGWDELWNVMRLCEDATKLTPHVMTPTELTPRMSERMADDVMEVF